MNSAIIKNQFYTDKGLTEYTYEVNVGETVGFKSDIEQSAKVIGISEQRCPIFGSRRVRIQVENKNGLQGEYLQGQTKTWLDASEIHHAKVIEERVLDD